MSDVLILWEAQRIRERVREGNFADAAKGVFQNATAETRDNMEVLRELRLLRRRKPKFMSAIEFLLQTVSLADYEKVVSRLAEAGW